MKGVSLTPMAGAQGEFAGVAMIRAYHRARGDFERTEIIVPDAAHGTNPATATMCGCTVIEVPSLPNGDMDVEALKQALGPRTAGIMLTNPSTLGVFERRIQEVAKLVHEAGGLLYYDGANLNAILGKVRPGDMGFDVIHMNLHKTFSTPHGGGGPGSGAVGVGRAPAAVPADPDRGARGRSLSLARRARRAADDRPAVRVHGQRRRVAARVHLHADARPRRHAARGRVCYAQCQLHARAAEAGGLRRCVSGSPREPRVHHHAQAPGEAARRQRDGLRQAAARPRLPCADHLFSAARAGVPADRADGDRKRRKSSTLSSRRWLRFSAKPNRMPRRSRAPRILCRSDGWTTSAPRNSSI